MAIRIFVRKREIGKEAGIGEAVALPVAVKKANDKKSLDEPPATNLECRVWGWNQSLEPPDIQ